MRCHRRHTSHVITCSPACQCSCSSWCNAPSVRLPCRANRLHRTHSHRIPIGKLVVPAPGQWRRQIVRTVLKSSMRKADRSGPLAPRCLSRYSVSIHPSRRAAGTRRLASRSSRVWVGKAVISTSFSQKVPVKPSEFSRNGQ